MSNNFYDVLNKTQELENNIKWLDEKLKNSTPNPFTNIKCNLLNYPVIASKKIIISNTNLKKSKVYFDCKISLNTPFSQEVNFYFLVDEFCLKKVSKKFGVGTHEISISDSYKSYKNTPVEIGLQIFPVLEKVVYLEKIELLINGIECENLSDSFDGISIDNSYFLSFVNNQNLYIKTVDKKPVILNVDDMDFYCTAKQHCLIKNSKGELVLFKIDLNNNLFCINLSSNNETLLAQNATHVSAICKNNNIAVSYIQNKGCYFFEIENGMPTIHKKITAVCKPIISSKLFVNEFNNKLFIILTDSKLKNYMLESLEENASNGESLQASFNINITLQEVNNEI